MKSFRFRAVDFDGQIIGLAYLSGMCNYEQSCAFTVVSIRTITNLHSSVKLKFHGTDTDTDTGFRDGPIV